MNDALVVIGAISAFGHARELGFKVTILAGACATVDPQLEQISLR